MRAFVPLRGADRHETRLVTPETLRAPAVDAEADTPAPGKERRYSRRHTLTFGAVVAALGAVAGLMHAYGLRLTTEKEATAAPGMAETALGGEEGAASSTPTRERVRLLEERAGRVETAVVEMRDRVGSLATQQAVMVERSDALKEQVQKASSDNAARFDRISDKLDAIRDARHR